MQMSFRTLFLAAGLLSIMLLSGCGGGGDAAGPAADAPGNSVGGTTAVGPILDAKVLVFRAGSDDANDDSKALNAASPASTDSTGKYSVDVGSYAGPLIVKVIAKTTSKMCDELTGRCDLAMPANFKLRAALPSVGANTVAHITPFTEMAANALGSDFSAGMINAANSAVRVNVLGGLDPLTTKPVVDNSTAFTDAQRLDQKNMVLMLAAVNNTDVDGTCAVKVGGEKIQCAVDGLRGMLTAVNAAASTSTTDATKLGALKNALAGLGSVNIPTLNAGGILHIDTRINAATDVDAILRREAMTNISAGEHPLPSSALLSAVDKGKAFFRDQRAISKLYANGNGFLDNPSTHILTEVNGAIAPSINRIKGRIDGLEMATKLYNAVSDNSWVNNIGSSDGQYAVLAARDTQDHLVAGKVWITSSVYDYSTNTQRSCHTNDLTGTWGNKPYSGVDPQITGGNSSASAALTKVTCKLYSSISPTKNADGSHSNQFLLLDEVKPSPANASNFTFSAQDFIEVFSPTYATGAAMPSSAQYRGSVALARNSSGNPASVTIDAWFPGSASGITKEHLKVDSTITYSTATKRLDFSGLLAAYSGTQGNDVLSGDILKSSLNFGNGSYFLTSLALPAASAGSTGAAVSNSASAHVEVTASIGATQFVGSIDVGSYLWDSGSYKYIPTAVTLAGALSDTSIYGAGGIMTGKFELAVADYGLYNATLPESSSNYVKNSATFTGTLKYPSTPNVDFALNAARTGLDTATENFNIVVCSGKTLAGSATINRVGSSSITLTNQDGISVTLTANGTADVIATLNGVTIATIKSDGNIYYLDGAIESLR